MDLKVRLRSGHVPDSALDTLPELRGLVPHERMKLRCPVTCPVCGVIHVMTAAALGCDWYRGMERHCLPCSPVGKAQAALDRELKRMLEEA